MFDKMLKVNISQFNEEEETENQQEDFSQFIDGDNLDVQGLIDAYGGQQEETTPTDEGDENGEPDEQGEPEQPTESEEQQTEQQTQEPEQQTEQKRTPDQAFAEMRRRAEQYEKTAKWVESLAQKQGFQSPEQLIEAFNKQQLAREAQEKGVPVDVYERLQRLEEENRAKEETLFRERFNNEVEQTKEKYKLTDEQITEVFRYMGQNGYITQEGRSTITFEDAYTLANKDTLIQQAEERAKQEYLKSLEKKQKQATPDVGTHANDKQTTGELDYSTENIFKTLEEMDIEWR